jgi:hypothetical protein
VVDAESGNVVDDDASDVQNFISLKRLLEVISENPRLEPIDGRMGSGLAISLKINRLRIKQTLFLS